MLDDLALFVSIVDEGSLQAAARRVGLPPATLTRRLQRLEADLGCQLLLRSARSLRPTPEGVLYYEQCRPLLVALRQATTTLDDDLNQVKGTLRVLAPINVSRSLLAPAWASFLKAWPQIRLELKLSNMNEDLWRNGADLALRVGTQSDPKLHQRRLGAIPLLLVAAPEYLAARGTPAHPDDLQHHDLLVTEPLGNWQFRKGDERIEVKPEGRCYVNEIDVAVGLAEAGLGLLYCSRTLCYHGLDSGRLVQLLPDWRCPLRPIYAVWPQETLPRKVRALLEHLAAHMQAIPMLQYTE
jgi:LysR family transcriptional regulator AphB